MKRIAVICWWTSPEKDISIRSGKTWFDNIDMTMFTKEFFVFPDEYEEFFARHTEFDLVIPVFHGVGWEDWQIFAFLNQLGLTYLYSDFEAHCLAMNKFVSNEMVKSFGYDIPVSYLIQKGSDIVNVDIPWQVIVKPNRWGSSIDTQVFPSISQAQTLIDTILTYDDVLVQQFTKWRELTVSIYWDYDKSFKSSWITEIVTQREFFDLKAKYELDQTEEVCPANIPDDLQTKVENIAMDLYFRFKFKTLARIDFIYYQDQILFLESNTIPGFTPASLFPKTLFYHGFNSIQDFVTHCISQRLW